VIVRSHASFAADYPTDRGVDDLPAGREIAELLRGGLERPSNIELGTPEPHDYAWEFVADLRGGRFSVMIGLVEDRDRQWLALAHPARRVLRRTIDPKLWRAVVGQLDDTLASDPSIRNFQWFTEEEWNDPSFGDGAGSPFDRGP
jgi:hypothetical protein